MVGFIIGLVVFGLGATYFILASKFKDEKIKGLIFSLVLAIAVGGFTQFKFNLDTKEWNNGICTNCNGSYEFVTAIKGYKSNYRVYYYTCDTCGKTIETTHLMEKN